LKVDPRLRKWTKKLPSCSNYWRILDVLESIVPILVAAATLLVFLILILNPGTLLAIVTFLLVLAVLGFARKC
jgi:mannose/fructose/N-acetylgalactosamine-specific phosphotransferase system component IID